MCRQNTELRKKKDIPDNQQQQHPFCRAQFISSGTSATKRGST
jgi:hypothetical protein